MNILHIVRKPDIGGSEVLVKNIINQNRDNSFNHYLLCRQEGPLLEMINPEKKKYILKTNNTKRIKFLYYLRKYIREKKIDIVHAHQAIDELYAVIVTVGMKVKIFRSFHGYEGFSKRNPKLPLRLKLIYWFCKNKINANLFVSKNLLEYYNTISKKVFCKQFVLYNGIPDLGLDSRIINDTDGQFGEMLEDEYLCMAMVGNFKTKGRDHLTICKALKILHEEGIQFKFFFIGKIDNNENGNYSEVLKFCKANGLMNNVYFLGQRTDAHNIVKDIDIYIHSANYETFGLALIEAMALGVPCIASDIATFAEITKEGKYAILFKTGSSIDLAKKILDLSDKLNDLEIEKRIGEAQEFVRNEFSIAKHLKKLHGYYYCY